MQNRAKFRLQKISLDTAKIEEYAIMTKSNDQMTLSLGLSPQGDNQSFPELVEAGSPLLKSEYNRTQRGIH
jgi:hypothetical protein